MADVGYQGILDVGQYTQKPIFVCGVTLWARLWICRFHRDSLTLLSNFLHGLLKADTTKTMEDAKKFYDDHDSEFLQGTFCPFSIESRSGHHR